MAQEFEHQDCKAISEAQEQETQTFQNTGRGKNLHKAPRTASDHKNPLSLSRINA
jgi:hypothetical protein